MSFGLISVDSSDLQRKFGMQSLAAKALTEANLSNDQICELLDRDDALAISHAACIRQCADRLLLACKHHEKVFIGGDYDADGICATAIMKDLFNRLGIDCGYYIPDRFREGYGLKPETVQAAVSRGYSLIITVDNGVAAKEAIKKAHDLGIDVIVTDHHQITAKPEADIIVHPTAMEQNFSNLSGAGVALEISRSLIGDMPLHTVLAAVASIGDVMPMWGENRKIVRQGLRLIREGKAPAVSALLDRASEADSTSIAFSVVPKLNSVSRMNDLSNVNTLVPYLLCKSEVQIRNYRDQLEDVNRTRRSRSAEMVERAEEKCDDADFYVLFDEHFQEGLNGLVAGRIAAAKRKPTLVLSVNNGLIKGSGRSIPGFNMFRFFSEDFEELTNFGGHEQAVGLSLHYEDLETFRAKIIKKMSSIKIEAEPEKKAILIDTREMTLSAAEEIQQLDPWPKELGPLFYALKDPVIDRMIRNPKVTKYQLHTCGDAAEAVLFSYRDLDPQVSPEIMIGNIEINKWKGHNTVQLNIESFKER